MADDALLVAQVRSHIAPLLDDLLEALAADHNDAALARFAAMAELLGRARNEADLIDLFGRHLAMAAPIALATNCSERVLPYIDAVLAAAEQVAFTLAGPGTVH
jgi:hypothetical protein